MLLPSLVPRCVYLIVSQNNQVLPLPLAASACSRSLLTCPSLELRNCLASLTSLGFSCPFPSPCQPSLVERDPKCWILVLLGLGVSLL